MKIKLEYVWLDGYKPEPNLRSKMKIVDYNDVKNAIKSYEAAQKSLEARRQAFNFSKERYEVGLLNAFDFSQATLALENAQSEVIRTKYDYIFRTKILEFYFGIPLIKKQ